MAKNTNKSTRAKISQKQMKAILKTYHKGMMSQFLEGSTFEDIQPGSFNISAAAEKAGVKESTFKNYVAKVHRSLRLARGLKIAATGAPVPNKFSDLTNEKFGKWNLIK